MFAKCQFCIHKQGGRLISAGTNFAILLSIAKIAEIVKYVTLKVGIDHCRLPLTHSERDLSLSTALVDT